ncbi:ABC transporter permease [Nocardioides seonyuensis]|uniref:ABC transporter permease n=1 Tax=Nocardioides seonyuensis TaxID=2518371 RepID=UPI001ABDFA76|nr:ABC transporter permease [Nocardioides seonyuensis]
MSFPAHAVRLGLRRGCAEFLQSLRSTQDQGFYLFTGLLVLGYLFLRRNTEVEGTDLLLPSVALPSILGALITFGVVIGPAYALAMEKEDGTLLRHKAVPHGLVGYFTSQLFFQSASLVPQLLVILVPAFFLFDNLMAEPSGWFTVLWVLVLGLLAAMPIGIVIGALVPGTQKVGTGHAPRDGPRRDLRDLLPAAAAVGVGAGRRAGLPDVLDRAGHALGLPSRAGRRARGR